MWPWTKRGPNTDDVMRRLESIERELRGIKTEWLDMHEKLTAVDGRIRKRQERETTPEPVLDDPRARKALLRARVLGRGGNGTHP